MTIPRTINRQTYLFVVKHITRNSDASSIYGITLNETNYFFSKTRLIEDCKQLDSRPLLDPVLFKELCGIITEIESAYSESPPLDQFNQDIGTILKRIRIGPRS